jgi:uncharacterized protein YdeI (YjbR/CyaY-like superfamily)
LFSTRDVAQPFRAATLDEREGVVMGKRDPRVDAHIAEAADSAKPILTRVREAVHASCPDVEEAMKWRFPHFMYKGMLRSMASFREHAAFGFWKGSLVLGDRSRNDEAMGQMGRLKKVSDLPSKKTLAHYIRKAMTLNDEGVKVERSAMRRAPKASNVPAELATALKKNKKAQSSFGAFSPSHKREYVEWITEAKNEDTRARRLRTAVEWIAEGKSRNWNYVKT